MLYRNCFLKPTNLLAESEVYMKDPKIKSGIFRVLCLAAKNHGQSFSTSLSLALFSHPTRKSELMMETFFVVCTDVQMTIMQNLQYTEHLSEPMAELITVFTKEFDNDILGEKVLGYALSHSLSLQLRAYSQLNRIHF